MKFYRVALGICVFAAMIGTASAESTLDLNLDDNSARIAFNTPITPTGLYANAAFLYNQDRGDVFNAGVHLIGDAGVGPNPLHAGLGGQFYYINPDISGPPMDCPAGCIPFEGPGSGEAIAIGGFVQYQLPRYNRIGFGAHIYYAPGIISFGGLDRMLEYGVRADYQVLRNANVYIGYRQIKADFGPGFLDMDSGFHVGMQLNF
ncbi:MAG TPA: YfaZ family outer membrane protein [Gammaproteobacteria bacterium]|nr:YfaZ family outer membrane protein [Gammaproteobacteria bacterium]